MRARQRRRAEAGVEGGQQAAEVAHLDILPATQFGGAGLVEGVFEARQQPLKAVRAAAQKLVNMAALACARARPPFCTGRTLSNPACLPDLEAGPCRRVL
jgi:hypothetical protein